MLAGLSAFPLIMSESRLGAARIGNPVSRLPLDGCPALAVGAVRGGRVLAAGGEGLAAGRRIANADTIFEIGSLTKTFTACLIFQLQEEGRVRIDAPVADYVPDLPISWRALRLSELLSHTAGLPEYLDRDNFRRDIAPREIVALAADKPLQFPAGARHAYNNTGFILLGMVAEAVTGKNYWDELRRRFFQPAGMTSTGPRTFLPQLQRYASGHFWDGSRYDDDPPRSAPGSTWSAGGLLSTAADINRWSVALDRGLLSADVRSRMWQPARLANGEPAGWGYGWEVETEGDRTIVSHGGGTAGFSCWYRRDTMAPLSTIVLTNQNGRADPKTMTETLLSLLRV
jgi:CubicO group peptidase (beta-lactamase class C family)